MKLARARRLSSSSTRLRKTTERNRVTDSHIHWLKSHPSRDRSCTGKEQLLRKKLLQKRKERAVKKPSLKSMKKAELIEFAKENNIEIDEKATKRSYDRNDRSCIKVSNIQDKYFILI